jgi:hypothetical protein
MRQGKRRASDVVKPDQFASVLRSGSASAAETGTIQKLLCSRSAVATENSENAEKSRVLGLTAVVSPACLSMCVHRRRSCPPIPWPGRSGIGEPCSPSSAARSSANGRVDPVCLRSTACSGSCSPSESPGLGILRGSAQTARVQRLCARPIGTRERSNGEPLRVTSTFSPRASNSVPMPDLERNVRVETTDIASDATRSNLSNSATLSLREPGLLAAV